MKNWIKRLIESMKHKNIEILPIIGLPIFQKGDDLVKTLRTTMLKNRIEFIHGDILVISHKIISIIEGSIYIPSKIEVGTKAETIASQGGYSNTRVEIALRESSEIIRESPVLITKTKHGLITDFSGIDESNAPNGSIVALPKNPDASAQKIHAMLADEFGFNIPVIITDTQGRPWRKGAVNIAIGIAGLSAFTQNKGVLDIFGRPLRSSVVCIADEIAASSELVMGQADEKTPVVIVRGLHVSLEKGNAKSIIRPDVDDLFR